MIGVIEQLEKTGNRPHLIKELAAVLSTTRDSVQRYVLFQPRACMVYGLIYLLIYHLPTVLPTLEPYYHQDLRHTFDGLVGLRYRHVP